MNVNELINRLEAAYGSYNEVMASRIKSEFRKFSLGAIDKIYVAVTGHHTGTRPPNLGIINRIIEDRGLSLALHEEPTYCSVCEFCGCRFDIQRGDCPACNKRRRFGVVMKGDPETPSEIQERIRARSQGVF